MEGIDSSWDDLIDLDNSCHPLIDILGDPESLGIFRRSALDLGSGLRISHAV